MHAEFQKICAALDDLASSVKAASGENRTFCEIFGWNAPAITRLDICQIAKDLASDIREASPSGEIDPELLTRIAAIPQQLQHLKANTLPQLFNGGNAFQAANALINTLQVIRSLTSPVLPSWEKIDDPSMMPHKLAKRVRSLNAQLSETTPELDKIESKIRLIQEATAAAESLPTDLEALKLGRTTLETLSRDAQSSGDRVRAAEKNASEALQLMQKSKQDADGLIGQLQDLHRVGTSTALAGAFEARAKRLNESMYIWVIVLIGALGTGIAIGAGRVDVITTALASQTINWNAVWLNCVLSILSLGAPVWLAWIATKQIGQRFRLAEDYAYKASISNAYEGYRREAVRLDDEFEARLFGSALTRFDEAPLRLVEKDTHGSPLHEFFNSAAFKAALEASNDLKDTFVSMLKRQGTRPPATAANADAAGKSAD